TLVGLQERDDVRLGGAGNGGHRHLQRRGGSKVGGWGWPGIAAHVHLELRHSRNARAGDGRELPLTYTLSQAQDTLRVAGDGRELPLTYTRRKYNTAKRRAGDGRELPLTYTRLRHIS